MDVLKCFLTSRSHYTSLGSSFSPPASTNLGVSQGTKAGLIFFNYAVNDTFRCDFLMSPSTRITVIADDTTPLIGGTHTGGDNALDIIHKFGDHFCSKNLSFNVDTSSEMLLKFGRHDVSTSLASTESLLLNYFASYSTKSRVLMIMWNTSQN